VGHTFFIFQKPDLDGNDHARVTGTEYFYIKENVGGDKFGQVVSTSACIEEVAVQISAQRLAIPTVFCPSKQMLGWCFKVGCH
jgi:hypothetical protein